MQRRTFLEHFGRVSVGAALTNCKGASVDPDAPWPGQRQAAVSFTYDDGMASHLDAAVSDLAGAGLRGTFYLFVNHATVKQRVPEWRLLFQHGHEIGNHTMNHPCRSNGKLQTYDANSLEQLEIGAAEHWLNVNVGVDPNRTYAYPCGDMTLGPDPGREDTYLSVVRHNVFAARTTQGSPNTPDTVRQDPWRIHAQEFRQGGLSPFELYLNETLRINGWAVFLFHGIGPESPTNYLATPRTVHQALIDYVKQREAIFWIAPLRDVARHILPRI